MRKVFGPKRDEVTDYWTKRFQKCYPLITVVRMIKLRRIRWMGSATGMRETRNELCSDKIVNISRG
jgi:hypothetical protein